MSKMSDDAKNKIEEISFKLTNLINNPDYEKSQDVIIDLVNLIGIKPNERKKLYSFVSDQKFIKNENWFQWHPIVKDKRAAEILNHDNKYPFEIKVFWISKISLEKIKGIVHFTPNYEDNFRTREEEHSKIGIDFIITPKSDGLIIAISNNGRIRTLELKGKLNNTQKRILLNWSKICKEEIGIYKEFIHKSLWDTFELKVVNQEFYDMISSYFTELRLHLNSKHKISEDKSKSFANRLIGRILFTWFLRKKGLIFENSIEYFNTDNLEDTKYYTEKLELLFFNTFNKPINDKGRNPDDHKTPYLNGGLFKKNEDDIVKENYFPSMFFSRLFTHLEEYNFTSYESTHDFEQVAIDPEMLGRVLENLLASMKTETGEQARKAKGSFYTSRDIVSYMCRETIRNYLYSKDELKIFKNEIDRIIDTPDYEWANNESNKVRDISKKDSFSEKALLVFQTLKTIDPACGSGAYPIGMLQELHRIYMRLDRNINEYDIKLNILQNNIYGVDIDAIAIEISRLRAFLALIVDQEYNEKNSNGGIDTLPNLEFKFVCANTLLKLDDSQGGLYDGMTKVGSIDIQKEVLKIKKAYFKVDFKEKEELEQKISKILGIGNLFESDKYKQLRTYNPIKQISPASFYDPKLMHDVDDNFDIVIGNPPYVSTKGTTEDDKKLLEKNFGFADDLYSHFYFRGIELCKIGGILSYITSKTFWTIQTKKNLRELILNKNVFTIYDTANPFESAMVDTCIITLQNNSNQQSNIEFLKINEKTQEIQKYEINKDIYQNAVNKVIFIPTTENLKIYEKYNNEIKFLMEKWWDKIKTSKDIEKNKTELEKYRNSLKPGDVTLLGLITDGGQGLATGNNGKYVGVLEGTKEAEKAKNERVKKFIEFSQTNDYKKYGQNKLEITSILNNLKEKDIRNLFDGLKEEYGRDIFGQGFLFRIISKNEIKNVEEMTEEEKINGLAGERTYVPYDKGDKDGNRWYLKTPYYINWSKEVVSFLKKNSGRKGSGMPVVRNPQFYFRSGFCWNLTNGTRSTNDLKFKIIDSSVNDVSSMKLTSVINLIPNEYIATVCNSKFINKWTEMMVNSTLSFQINDARQIPIVVPSKGDLETFLTTYKIAHKIKLEQYNGNIEELEANSKLKIIEKENDLNVNKLYGI